MHPRKRPASQIAIQVPDLNCSTCSFGEIVPRRNVRDVQLFPGATGPSFTNKLGSVAGNLGLGEAVRLRTHSAPRGAAATILESGGSFTTLFKGGRGHSSAYRLYLDLGSGEAAAPAPVPMEATDDERPGGQGQQGRGFS